MTSPVTSLDQLPAEFARRFNARDLTALTALNAPGAVFVPAPGQPVTGDLAVAGALEQFLAIGLPISMTVRNVFVNGAVGLAIADWKLEGTAADGSQVALGGSTADVAVFDEEHGWRYAIDNPFGTV
ncbi:YybH family protein [Microbacterium sp. Clip185]|uniref:YybH family protein n=1 Tax=Microbacterium sp. Clip185 TaxID=3025663 RepID=UPI00236509AF|nr:nuclear transport factor 2 family protein [Microbacterium sp. Clip185]WDG17496.1 nuclear transport factor 2 family protein [Microbacterium sp. Clip185]